MRKLKLQYDTRQIDRLWQDSGKAKDNDINNNNVSKYQLKGGTQYTRSYSNIDNNYIGEQTNDNHVTNTNTNTNNDTNNNMKINLTRILDIKLSSSKNKNNNNNRLPVRSVSKDKLHLDQKELQYISRRSNVKTQGCQFVWNKLGLAKQKDRGENGVENGKGHAQTHRNISGYTQLHL